MVTLFDTTLESLDDVDLMAALSSVSFSKQSHRALVLIADPGMEAAVSPHTAPSQAPHHYPIN